MTLAVNKIEMMHMTLETLYFSKRSLFLFKFLFISMQFVNCKKDFIYLH